jgi:hypothetical protein
MIKEKKTPCRMKVFTKPHSYEVNLFFYFIVPLKGRPSLKVKKAFRIEDGEIKNGIWRN